MMFFTCWFVFVIIMCVYMSLYVTISLLYVIRTQKYPKLCYLQAAYILKMKMDSKQLYIKAVINTKEIN